MHIYKIGLCVSLWAFCLAHHTLLAAETQPFDSEYDIDTRPVCQLAGFETKPSNGFKTLSGDELLQMAETYQRSGHYQKSIAVLCFALKNTSENNPFRKATLLGSLGYAYFMNGGAKNEAAQLLEKSQAWAIKLGQFSAASVALNNLGQIYATYPEKRDQALMFYQKSAALANQSGHDLLAVKAMINWVQTQLETVSTFQDIETPLLNIKKKIQRIKRHKIPVRLRMGQLIRLIYKRFPAYKPHLLSDAYVHFNEALRLAQEQGDIQTCSQAFGYLGLLYQDEQRYSEALTLTRRAVFFAQEINALEILYAWQWQTGKILKALGKNEEALLSYRAAVKTLLAIRYDLAKIYRASRSSFRDKVGAVFMELAALLLEQASHSPLLKREALLKETQNTLEQLKAAELLDYFQDACVIKEQKKLDEILPDISNTTAILYSIIFEQRLELLLYKQGQIIQQTVPITQKKLTHEINALREKLSSYHNPIVIPKQTTPAQTLYNWLIRPLTNELEGIDTLVFVPDGILRTLPIAALHNGENYLIKEYALAIVPGLTLTVSDSKDAKPSAIHMLLAGLQSFELELPSTQREINRIIKSVKAFSDNSQFTQLLNEAFTKRDLKKALIRKAHFAVHISSHAVFKADIKNTYIVSGEGHLTLDEFENTLAFNRIHEPPLNIMTLSACETALGDDRAALGLGGIALRAGAQSAVATLWSVDQAFSAYLMPLFYEQVSRGKLSKAQALQKAQLKMMEKTALHFDHPHFWAAFILIGNWL